MLRVTTTLLLISISIVSCVFPSLAQHGQHGLGCNNTGCVPHQTCYDGYCRCDPGYVKGHAEGHFGCWEVKSYGEVCLFEEQCVDHRMQCNTTESGDKRCLCNRFHKWDEEFKACIQTDNITAVLGIDHEEEQDTAEINSRSEHEMFIKISVVGLIAVITICIFIVTCIAYGCCSCTRSGDKDVAKADLPCPPTCPLHKVPLLQREHLPAQEGKRDKWKDMCSMPASFDDIDIC